MEDQLRSLPASTPPGFNPSWLQPLHPSAPYRLSLRLTVPVGVRLAAFERSTKSHESHGTLTGNRAPETVGSCGLEPPTADDVAFLLSCWPETSLGGDRGLDLKLDQDAKPTAF